MLALPPSFWPKYLRFLFYDSGQTIISPGSFSPPGHVLYPANQFSVITCLLAPLFQQIQGWGTGAVFP